MFAPFFKRTSRKVQSIHAIVVLPLPRRPNVFHSVSCLLASLVCLPWSYFHLPFLLLSVLKTSPLLLFLSFLSSSRRLSSYSLPFFLDFIVILELLQTASFLTPSCSPTSLFLCSLFSLLFFSSIALSHGLRPAFPVLEHLLLVSLVQPLHFLQLSLVGPKGRGRRQDARSQDDSSH